MPRFAANLSTLFKEVDFLDRFHEAASCGFKAVEFLFPYDYKKEELKKILDENKLEVALFNTVPGDPSKGEWGHAGVPGKEQDFKAEIENSLDYAIALNCKTVHVMSAVVPHPWEKEIYKRTFVKNIRMAAALFAKYDKHITMEALCPEIKPNYLYHSQFETLELMEEIACDNVFIQLDIFHAQMVDGQLTHLIKDYVGKYGHVQIASAPDRHEPDEGEINYPYIFKLFDEVGYKGYIGCEYNPRTTTKEGLSWIKPYLK